MKFVEYYPFRPQLEGPFLERFNKRAQEVAEAKNPIQVIERVAPEEYRWATKEFIANPRQRRIYRAVWLLLRDLLAVEWKCRWHEGTLELAQPDDTVTHGSNEHRTDVKRHLRKLMSEPRKQKLREAEEFIRRMEDPGAGKTAITQLIANGQALAEDLEQILRIDEVTKQKNALASVVDPYLQLVEEGALCPETQLKLSDIWRYFRLTWSNPAENTPGRTMQYLIRDRARPFHPVMGIASLENSPIRIEARDRYLGWHLDRLIEELDGMENKFAEPDLSQRVKHRFVELLKYTVQGLEEIDWSGLCTLDEFAQPDDAVLAKLLEIAAEAKQLKEKYQHEWTNSDDETKRQTKGELGNIDRRAEEEIYRRKRAEQLYRLLSARRELSKLLESKDFAEQWRPFLKSEAGQTIVRTAFQAQKSRHVGTSIMELNVCGAIPPYNHLLGGKLVALSVLSPQVVADYRSRYGARKSDIASRLKNEEVFRPAELVYIGTSSLYKVGSSQYNRLMLPAGLMGVHSPPVKWVQFDQPTQGYGTLHIQKVTLECIEEAAVGQDGVKRVNHVFGEGPSPKLRILRTGIDKILQDGDRRVAQDLPKHAMGRLVYGAMLAKNCQDYLLGRAEAPDYYFGNLAPEEGTRAIIDYWRNRWLHSRLNHAPLLGDLRSFDPTSLRVSKDLSNDDDDLVYEAVKQELPSREGDSPMEAVHAAVTPDAIRLREFAANLYRGSSSFADRIEHDLLKAIHVSTRLDHAVLDALKEGKDVLFTGNPGDGKTHLLRILEAAIQRLSTRPLVELDASKVPDEELYQMWARSREEGRPFVLAINEAVLFNLAKKYPEFQPLREARQQVEDAIVYDDTPIDAPLSVVVFDLNLRNMLSTEIVGATLDKLTEEDFARGCTGCPWLTDCDFQLNRKLLRNERFRARLQLILDRVSRRGYHATVREVEALAAFLLFGGRGCLQLTHTSGDTEYLLPQLPFKGQGALFDQLRRFDPAAISHPVWDDLLISSDDTVSSGWDSSWGTESNSIHLSDTRSFAARKRAFFFFHQAGEQLWNLSGNIEAEFDEFLGMQTRDAIRLIIKRINRFFGTERETDELRVWQSHRYNQEPRRVLVSAFSIPRQKFELAVPRLIDSMQAGFDLAKDHVLLRIKDKPSTKLKIDFAVFELLAQADRGVPVRFIETAATRRLWQFMEHLAGMHEWDDEQKIVILDTETNTHLTVTVDLETRQFLTVKRQARDSV